MNDKYQEFQLVHTKLLQFQAKKLSSDSKEISVTP